MDTDTITNLNLRKMRVGINNQFFTELEKSVFIALKTYSNIDRGSGQYSQITTALVEKARENVLDYFKLDKKEYVVIFCSPWRAEIIVKQLPAKSFKTVSSLDIGLSIGVRALAVKKNALPKGIPPQTGGGMIKLVSPNSLVLADAPERFEAGTPAIINIIAFTKALRLLKDKNIYQEAALTVNDILYHNDFQEYSGSKLLHQLKKTKPDCDIRVPTKDGEIAYTNFDNAASTPAFTPVWETVCKTWKQPLVVQQNIVTEVKKICAEFLGAPSSVYDIIFCANTTEAVNIAAKNLTVAKHLSDAKRLESEPVILNTMLEHHSNELPWRYLKGASLVRLSVNNEGFINLHELEHQLIEYNQRQRHGNKRITLVAVSGASNVLGTYNDIKKIAKIAHKYNARVFVDAAQLVAHRKISMLEDEIDYLAFSGHKMYPPFGSGALVVRKGLLNFSPNELAKIKASGEENVAGIAAIGKAINLLQRIGMKVIKEEETLLTQYALQKLSNIKGLQIFGIKDTNSDQFKNKGGIIAFRLKHVPHNLVAKELAEKGGIGVRTGCFCAHLITKQLMKIHPFRSLLAEVFLKYTPFKIADYLPGIVRISIGLENDKKDIDHLVASLHKIADKPRSFANGFIASVYNGTPFLAKTDGEKKMEKLSEEIVHMVYFMNMEFKEAELNI